jgi:hypothetical protein
MVERPKSLGSELDKETTMRFLSLYKPAEFVQPTPEHLAEMGI